MGWQSSAAIFIVFAPLLGAIISGFLAVSMTETTGTPRRDGLDRVGMLATTGLLFASAVLAAALFFSRSFGGWDGEHIIVLGRWLDIGSLKSFWAIRMDTISIVMMFVVTGVSSLVHLYSWGYMADDRDRARFFSYLSLFTFAMLMLVTANDFIQLFFGWEGVGLASYLLIGYYYRKPSANSASIKAFVTNRVGDVGFALGIMAVYLVFGTVEFFQRPEADAPLGVFDLITSNASITPLVASLAEPGHAQEIVMTIFGITAPALEIIGILLFIGAMGKSAQLLLHVWLPDAMEGPTPVSALIHAATMVTAGVVLVCRASPIYEYTTVAADVITVVGATTALFAATVGLAQNDIKRVIAYSTCSQLGYMFFAAGVGAYSAAMFHLFTHAFFKAMLFLTAGAVIHGMHHEQDMRNMGGLRKKMPIAWLMMLLGTLAITGVGIPGTKIGFAGFFSKDAILEEAFLSGDMFSQYAFWCGIAAAVLTSFYSWRLMFMTFEGPTRADKHTYDHAHDAPNTMRIPLYVLGVGAVLGGVMFYSSFIHQLGSPNKAFWNHAIYQASAHHDESDKSHAEEDVVHGDDHHEAPAHVESHEVADAAHDDGHGEAHADDGHHGHGLHPPTWVLWTPFSAWMFGLALAVIFYLIAPSIPRGIGQKSGPLHAFLYNKWYFDEIYNFTLVRGVKGLGDLFWKVGDRKLIDGLGPDGLTSLTKAGSGRLSKLHTGYLYHYAFVILIAAVAFGAVAWLGQTGGR